MSTLCIFYIFLYITLTIKKGQVKAKCSHCHPSQSRPTRRLLGDVAGQGVTIKAPAHRAGLESPRVPPSFCELWVSLGHPRRRGSEVGPPQAGAGGRLLLPGQRDLPLQMSKRGAQPAQGTEWDRGGRTTVHLRESRGPSRSSSNSDPPSCSGAPCRGPPRAGRGG